MADAPAASACKVIIVEGNISAGKSTLCKRLMRELNKVLYLEPTVENPFLEPYYREPKKYALPMQLWLLKQRFVTYVRALKFAMSPETSLRGVILDRSIFSDIVFAEKNFRDGNFTREGYDYYLALREKMLAQLPEPHIVVYLDTDPKVCYDRIHNLRQRSCEDGIPLEYLAGLDDCYKNFVKGMEGTASTVFVAPWNKWGGEDDVMEKIVSAAAEPIGDRSADEAALRKFMEDEDALAEAMTMPHTIPEAEGADVDVVDPDFVTTAEARVMPPSPRTAKRMLEASEAKDDEETETPELSAPPSKGPSKRRSVDAFSPEPTSRHKARTGRSPQRPSPTSVVSSSLLIDSGLATP